MTSYRWVPEELKTVLSNCDAKRDHNYSLGADSFTITTREYALLCEVISAAPAESGDALVKEYEGLLREAAFVLTHSGIEGKEFLLRDISNALARGERK